MLLVEVSDMVEGKGWNDRHDHGSGCGLSTPEPPLPGYRVPIRGKKHEADAVGVIELLGLVLHLAGVPDHHANFRQATSVVDTASKMQNEAAQGRNLTLVPVLYVLACVLGL